MPVTRVMNDCPDRNTVSNGKPTGARRRNVREPLRCRERRESHQSDGGISAPLVHPVQRMSVDACRSFQGTRGLQRRKWVPAGSIATERRFAFCICSRLLAPTDPRFRSPNEPHPLSTLPTGHPCISRRMWEMFGFCSSQVMRTPLSFSPSASHVKRVRARTRARAGGRTRAGGLASFRWPSVRGALSANGAVVADLSSAAEGGKCGQGHRI